MGAIAENLGIKSRTGEGSNKDRSLPPGPSPRVHQADTGIKNGSSHQRLAPTRGHFGNHILLCPRSGPPAKLSQFQIIFSTFLVHLQSLHPSHRLRKGLRTHTGWLLITHLLYIFTIWMRHRIGGMGGGKGGQGTLG